MSLPLLLRQIDPKRPSTTALPAPCRVYAVSLPCPFWAISGVRPGFGAPILADPPHGECDQSGRREAQGEQGGANYTVVDSWGSPDGFSPPNTLSDFVELKQRTCPQRIGLVGPAVKSRAGRPLALYRTSTHPSLAVYCRDTHHPQITHTSPAHHPQRVVSRRLDPPRAQAGRAALPPPVSGNRLLAVASTT